MKDIHINSMDIDTLLYLYEKYNFLYPAKKEKLAPLFEQLKSNMAKAFRLPDHLYRLLTCYDKARNDFASIAAWKFTPSTMVILHLVSTHPLKTREMFLYHIMRLAELQDENEVKSIMTYYQPKTVYVHRMFTHLEQNQTGKGVYNEAFNFYQLFASKRTVQSDVAVAPVENSDLIPFRQLVRQERGELYLSSLDFNASHIRLGRLSSEFAKEGLFRHREVLLARGADNKLLAALVINRGSVGLHFSLMENSAELIVDSRQNNDDTFAAVAALLKQAHSYYTDCPLGFIPLLIKPNQSHLLVNEDISFQRQYNMFICSRDNFITWGTYLFQEYLRSLNYAPTNTPLMA